MFPYRDSKVTVILLGIFFVVVIAYGLFEGRALLLGPQIRIPEIATEVDSPYITIAGNAAHIAALTMNGSPVDLTEEGDFEAAYSLSPGYNRITFDARDKYGATTQKILEIIYMAPVASSSMPTAVTSSSQSSSTQPVAPNM